MESSFVALPAPTGCNTRRNIPINACSFIVTEIMEQRSTAHPNRASVIRGNQAKAILSSADEYAQPLDIVPENIPEMKPGQ
jgi:hypothetical protein